MKLALAVLALAVQQPATSSVDKLKAEAEALKPLVKTETGKAFLNQVPNLPDPGERIVYRGVEDKSLWLSPAAYAKLNEKDKPKWQEAKLRPDFYYYTGYGSPLAYARAYDILGQHGFDLKNKRILDYGYGTVGHLRLLAQNGAHTVGVDVDPLLKVVYSKKEDTGKIGNGSVKLVEGFWPGTPSTFAEAGKGFDLFISKNTLKRGYIHPQKPVDKRFLVDLGVDDATFLKSVYNVLKPGGKFLIYNICGPLDMEKYNPSTDGYSPFTKQQYADAGFRVVAFDVEDTATMKEHAKALGWDKQGMDLEKGLFVWYTLLERR